MPDGPPELPARIPLADGGYLERYDACWCKALHAWRRPGRGVLVVSCARPECHPPRRVRLSRAQGWRMPPNTVSVARPTRWGNPYRVGQEMTTYTEHWVGEYGGGYMSTVSVAMTAEQAVACYRDELEARIARAATDPVDRAVADALEELRGRDLACWCPLDQPCHADVLLDWANR